MQHAQACPDEQTVIDLAGGRLATAQAILTVAVYMLDSVGNALGHVERHEQAARARGAIDQEALALTNRAVCLLRQGLPELASECAGRAVELNRRVSDWAADLRARTVLAAALARAGNVDQALGLARNAATTNREFGLPAMLPAIEGYSMLPDAFLCGWESRQIRGVPDDRGLTKEIASALRRLRIFSWLFPVFGPAYLLSRAVYEALAGRKHKALAFLERARVEAQALGLAHEGAMADLYQGLIESGDDRARFLSGARQAFARLGCEGRVRDTERYLANLDRRFPLLLGASR